MGQHRAIIGHCEASNEQADEQCSDYHAERGQPHAPDCQNNRQPLQASPPAELKLRILGRMSTTGRKQTFPLSPLAPGANRFGTKEAIMQLTNPPLNHRYPVSVS